MHTISLFVDHTHDGNARVCVAAAIQKKGMKLGEHPWVAPRLDVYARTYVRLRMSNQNEYILGTDPEELQRLGFQHRVWSKDAFALWERAGIGQGQRILDLTRIRNLRPRRYRRLGRHGDWPG